MVVTLAEFTASTTKSAPPAGLSASLRGMWFAAKGDWHKAHGIVQDDDSAAAAWVHAYLHRVEGDLPNARYWYGVAGKAAANGPPDAEWGAITSVLLQPPSP